MELWVIKHNKNEANFIITKNKMLVHGALSKGIKRRQLQAALVV